jgi:hypothetical protein
MAYAAIDGEQALSIAWKLPCVTQGALKARNKLVRGSVPMKSGRRPWLDKYERASPESDIAWIESSDHWFIDPMIHSPRLYRKTAFAK